MIGEGFRRIGGAFVAVVTGRRSKWAVLAVGIALAGVTGPLAGKLTPLEDNSPSAFLPADAASTEVLHYQEAHGTGTAPAIVVYERAGGLRPADQAVIARARAALAAGRLAAAGTPGPVITARNGRAALFSVPIASAAGQQAVAADVKAIRAEVARDALPATADGPPEALRVAVGGPAGSAAPATVLVRPPSSTGAALAAARGTPGVASVSAPARLGAAETFTVTLDAGPATPRAQQAVTALRGRLAAAAGPGTLVGGQTATNVDLAAAARHDRQVILPAVLAVVLVMLGLLLRSAVASVLLTATVVLSYLASLGIGSVVFRYLFSFPGYDPSVPIFAFVFLVALGIDYNIFLMTRVREEAAHAGTTAGTVTGLAVTGTVITSAGVVLAATFAVLAVLPLIALTEVGFLVAFGVLTDTIVVRSVLVPALAIDAGDRWWWPGTPAGRARRAEPATP